MLPEETYAEMLCGAAGKTLQGSALHWKFCPSVLPPSCLLVAMMVEAPTAFLNHG